MKSIKFLNAFISQIWNFDAKLAVNDSVLSKVSCIKQKLKLRETFSTLTFQGAFACPRSAVPSRVLQTPPGQGQALQK